MFVFKIVWVFVTVNPFVSVVYPSTGSSVTVYTISLPFAYFGLFVNLCVHSSPVPVNVADSTSSPFANKWTVILAGLLPSWLLLSDQVFLTSKSINSGLWVLTIFVPFTFY